MFKNMYMEDELTWDKANRVLSKRYYGRNDAAEMVGGKARLNRLIRKGLIRVHKISEAPNAKLFCNSWDCLKYSI